MAMTEQEYINVRDLSHVLSAEHTLRQICIANQPNIPKEEYKKVVALVSGWTEKMFKQIETRD